MSDELKACPFCKNSIEKRKRNNGVYAYHKATDICTLAGLWISADLWQSRPIEDVLLEAAKAALRSLEGPDGDPLTTEQKMVVTQLRAAIAQAEPDKAEGGEG